MRIPWFQNPKTAQEAHSRQVRCQRTQVQLQAKERDGWGLSVVGAYRCLWLVPGDSNVKEFSALTLFWTQTLANYRKRLETENTRELPHNARKKGATARKKSQKKRKTPKTPKSPKEPQRVGIPRHRNLQVWLEIDGLHWFRHGFMPHVLAKTNKHVFSSLGHL